MEKIKELIERISELSNKSKIMIVVGVVIILALIFG
tara:strand:- start:1677 stop:1784 length:108 start_codon:yes stop_codon:yes gene_type:complete